MRKNSLLWTGFIFFLLLSGCSGLTESGDDSTSSSEKEFSSFKIATEDNGTLTGRVEGNEITVAVPTGMDRTNLIASFTTTGAAVTVNGREQKSGSTINDFTNPVNYRVKAEDGSTKDYQVIVDSTVVYRVEGQTFDMVCVPGGLTYHKGEDNTGRETVADGYLIAATETTWGVWKAVYDWAVGGSGAPGAGQYAFNNGGSSTNSNRADHPVCNMGERDARIWCNALTEWYNAKMGSSYTPVYTNSQGAPFRDASDAAVDNSGDLSASGFRLLTPDEWQLAAKYIDGVTWNMGTHVSGDRNTDCRSYGTGSPVPAQTGEYIWYSSNTYGTWSQPVGMKKPNALGLYDMSGHLAEWCHKNSQYGYTLGGAYRNPASSLMIGSSTSTQAPNTASTKIGFRIGRTL